VLEDTDALPRDQWCVEKVLDLIDHMIQGEEKRREQEGVERRPDRGARAAEPLGGGRRTVRRPSQERPISREPLETDG